MKRPERDRYTFPTAKPEIPGFALGRLCPKINNRMRITGKLKPVASAAFLGVFGLLRWKESECCNSSTDLPVRSTQKGAAQTSGSRCRARYPQGWRITPLPIRGPLLSMIFSDLPSPAEAGFAKAGNRFPLFRLRARRFGGGGSGSCSPNFRKPPPPGSASRCRRATSAAGR
jgi:hypothetical protein